MNKIYSDDNFTIYFPDYVAGKTFLDSTFLTIDIFVINKEKSYSLTLTDYPLPDFVTLPTSVLLGMENGVVQAVFVLSSPEGYRTKLVTTDYFWIGPTEPVIPDSSGNIDSSTGDVSTGNNDSSTGDVSTGDSSTGNIDSSTGDVSTGDSSIGDVSTGDSSTGDIDSSTDIIDISTGDIDSSIMRISDGYRFGYSLWHQVPENIIIDEIPDEVFAHCYNLTSVTIPYGVTSIGSLAFSWCYNLTDISIPNSVTSIKDNAFYYCYNLPNITIPDSVTEIGYNAFHYCYNLNDIIIPDSVKVIGDRAFTCLNIKEITIPDSVTEIGGSLFSGCTKLEGITVGTGITELLDIIGENTKSLRWIKLLKPTVQTMIPTFRTSHYITDIISSLGIRVYVPDEIIEDYIDDSSWGAINSQIYPLSDFRYLINTINNIL